MKIKNLILAGILCVGAVSAQAAETIVDFTHINGQSNASDSDTRTTTSQTWDFSDTVPLVSHGETGIDSNTRLYGGMHASWSPLNDSYKMTIQLRLGTKVV